ncbi:hypothetical protein B0H19DRAFT_1248285 [Mycena capillaripes]|nr:hypothetical protein B0H19DRAFT_1248285 [Mycena capillaripes]
MPSNSSDATAAPTLDVPVDTDFADVNMDDLDIELKYKLAIEACTDPRTLDKVSRKEAHESQKALTTAQEAIFVEWIKGNMGASFQGPLLRRPAYQTDTLSRSLLCTGIQTHYLTLLRETIDKYDVNWKNVYNMDEKGTQLGKVLVDRDQRAVQHIEDLILNAFSFVCTKGTDSSRPLPSLAALWGASKPGPLRSAL